MRRFSSFRCFFCKSHWCCLRRNSAREGALCPALLVGFFWNRGPNTQSAMPSSLWSKESLRTIVGLQIPQGPFLVDKEIGRKWSENDKVQQSSTKSFAAKEAKEDKMVEMFEKVNDDINKPVKPWVVVEGSFGPRNPTSSIKKKVPLMSSFNVSKDVHKVLDLQRVENLQPSCSFKSTLIPPAFSFATAVKLTPTGVSNLDTTSCSNPTRMSSNCFFISVGTWIAMHASVSSNQRQKQTAVDSETNRDVMKSTWCDGNVLFC